MRLTLLLAILLVTGVLPAQQVQLTREVVVSGTERSRVEISGSRAIALAELAGTQVQTVTADGRRITVLQQGGSAEEAFRRISDIGWIGATDSLWVADQALQKVFVFSPTMTLVRSFGLPAGLRGSLPWVASRQLPAIHAVLGGDRLVLEGRLALPVELRLMQRAYPVLTREDGQVIATPVQLAVPDTSGCGQAVSWQGNSFSFIGLFCTVPIPAVSRVDGSLVTTPGIAAATTAVRVVRVSAQGDTLFDRQIPVDRRPLSAVEIDRAATALAAESPPSSPPELNRLVDSVRRATAPAFRIPFQRILIGLDGTTWLQRATGDLAEEWLVLDATGAPLFVVNLPMHTRLRAAMRESLWVAERAEAGREAGIARYRVTEGP